MAEKQNIEILDEGHCNNEDSNASGTVSTKNKMLKSTPVRRPLDVIKSGHYRALQSQSTIPRNKM